MPDGFKKFVIHNVKVSYDYLVIWFYIYVSVCSGKLNSQTLNFLKPLNNLNQKSFPLLSQTTGRPLCVFLVNNCLHETNRIYEGYE